MSWRLTLTAGGVAEPPAIVHEDVTVLQVVQLGMGQAARHGAPFTLEVAPCTDGGWTEAPTPTTTWDPRTATPLDGKQERPDA